LRPVLAGLFAALLLPILYHGIPNPVLFRWHWKHGSSTPPTDLADRAKLIDRLIPFVALGTIFLAVIALLHRATLTLQSLGLTHTGLRASAAYGLAAGASWLAVYAGILLLVRPPPSNFADHLPARWRLSLWLPLSLFSAFVEEIWRAYCLISLADLGKTVSISATTLAFGLAHLQPPGRLLSAMLFGAFAAYLFLATQQVWVAICAHAIVNVGVFFLIRWWRQ
jgi:Type II CAAX prenyl endopeptidase Rce1-like